MDDYVHGYDAAEQQRLQDQAATLVNLLHGDTRYPAGTRVLEAGCGVGAQTVTLAANSPEAHITSIDISEVSLAQARDVVAANGYGNVSFRQANIFDLSFAPESFDHVFVCFVLEHLRDPRGALAALRRVLRPGGTITVIEGDHGSTYFHPQNADANRAVDILVELQARGGGDALIGRRLYPLLLESGFSEPRVSPRMVYVDGSRPHLIEGFTKKTFAAMVAGVREPALTSGLATSEQFDRGIAGLLRAAEADGVFCYTFFKGVARKV